MSETAVLLDEIHPEAYQAFQEAGLGVIEYPKSIQPRDLMSLMQNATVLGVRSGPRVPAEAIQASDTLQAIGCYGVGFNHVDIMAAAEAGIPVFNAAHENTRSVADYVIGSVFSLLRKLQEHNMALHAGTWTKTAERTYEVRGKTLGIVGYGAIGSQVSVMAEAIGMSVLYCDPNPKFPPYGRARRVNTIQDLLKEANVVTLHVPGGRKLITDAELAVMQPGSYLINSSRADVVDVPAIANALEKDILAGFATDVYENEPTKKGDPFTYLLQGNPRVLLTPHVGGSTLEAQHDIGTQNTERLLGYLATGSTAGAVNVGELVLGPVEPDTTRLLHFHRDEVGVSVAIDKILVDEGLNISGQDLAPYKGVSYLMREFKAPLSPQAFAKIQQVDHTIRARVIAA